MAIRMLAPGGVFTFDRLIIAEVVPWNPASTYGQGGAVSYGQGSWVSDYLGTLSSIGLGTLAYDSPGTPCVLNCGWFRRTS